MTDDEYVTFCETCVDEFVHKNDVWMETFGIDGYPRWDYDAPTELLVFSGGPGPDVECQYIAVGTYSTKTGTWMWAWAKESSGDAPALMKVRDFGVEHGVHELSRAHFDADENDGWTLAAIAGHILGAEAIYRPVADHLLIFMLVMRTERRG